jgi:hypothetical protein
LGRRRESWLEAIGPAGKKEKGEGGPFGLDGEMVRVWFCFLFSFTFLFNLYSKIFSSFLKKLLNHTTNQKPMHST